MQLYKSKISLLSLISSHSLRPSICLLSSSKLAFHYSPALEIAFRINTVTSGDCLYSYIICNMSINESRQPYQYKHFKHSQLISESIIETTSSYILSFEHGIQLNSTISSHANNRKFGGMLRRFWQYLFHMQYEHQGVEITHQYSNSKHSQLTEILTSKNRIIVHLVVCTRQAIEFDSIKSG